MVERTESFEPVLPHPRAADESAEPMADRRPRLLRWVLPKACSSSEPLDGMQLAELKFIAYH